MGSANGPVAVSADGSVVAFGGSGDELLRIWRTGEGAVTPVCAAEPPAIPGQSSLSADGQLLAIPLVDSIRVLRRADGATVMWLPTSAPQFTRVDLSPRGNYLAIGPAGAATGGSAVVRLPSGAPVADFAPDSSGWLDFLFTPNEEKVYSLGKRSADYSIDAVTFASPGKVTSRVVPAYTTLLGFSDGCPVLYAASRGAWRSCGGCDDAPVAGGQPDQGLFGRDNAVLSSDGMFLAVAGPNRGSGVTLWRLRPDPAPLLTIGQRADEAAWQPQEFPVAITARRRANPDRRPVHRGAASAARGTRSTSATRRPAWFSIRSRRASPPSTPRCGRSPTARSSGARARPPVILAARWLAARPCCNRAHPYIPRTCGEGGDGEGGGWPSFWRAPARRARSRPRSMQAATGRRSGAANPVPVPSSADGGATGVVNPSSPAALCPPVRRGCPRWRRPRRPRRPLHAARHFRVSRCRRVLLSATGPRRPRPLQPLRQLRRGRGQAAGGEPGRPPRRAGADRRRRARGRGRLAPGDRRARAAARDDRLRGLRAVGARHPHARERRARGDAVARAGLDAGVDHGAAGVRYQLRFGGGVAFAPDGRAAVVSAGRRDVLARCGQRPGALDAKGARRGARRRVRLGRPSHRRRGGIADRPLRS